MPMTSTDRPGRTGRLRGGVVAGMAILAAILLAVPVPARAEEAAPFATAELWELAEYIDCNPGPEGWLGQEGTPPPNCAGLDVQGFGTRIADAYLAGYVSSAADSAFNGVIETDAASILSRVDWIGPAHGKLRINGGAVHAVFSGQLNLSLAMMLGQPIAPITGSWTGTKGTFQGGGRIEGMFLIPVPGGLVGLSDPFAYAALDAQGRPTGGFIGLRWGNCQDPAARGDYWNGIPMVKLVVSFYRN